VGTSGRDAFEKRAALDEFPIRISTQATLFLPHSTQAGADVDRIAPRHLSFCWHCSDWPHASLKTIENLSWDKSRARGVHVPVAIALLGMREEPLRNDQMQIVLSCCDLRVNEYTT
jgi:hypothetical protein